jgi:hypothetical protein
MNIKQAFYQAFCKHIWKAISKEYLRTERRADGYFTHNNYNYYVYKMRCIKCEREKIQEGRKLVA